MDNPLLEIRAPIPFDEVRAAHVTEATDALIARSRAVIDAIGPDAKGYDETLGALDRATAELDYALAVASHLEAVVGTQDLREAYAAALPTASAFYTQIVLSAPLYAALRTFAETDEARGLPPNRRRFLDKTLEELRRNGAELDAAGKQRLEAIDAELSQLTLTFSQNVVDATAAFELVLPDRSRLDGLPDGAIEAAARAAEERGVPGYRLTLQAPSYGPVMTFAHDRALREQLYRANVTRAAGGPHDNREIIARVLDLRSEKAALLGFPHFADLVTADRMAKSGAGARAFVERLRDAIRPAFERENEALCAFVKKEGGPSELRAWDTAYWAERMRRALYDFDEETLRPYFPLDAVMRGLFSVVSALYGVRVEPDEGAPVWHEDARAYRVLGEDGRRIGAFYVDLFPRETKRDGAWMGGMVDRLPGTPRERENVAVVVANVTPPRKPGAPALLNHREVETLFHEAGHMLHHILSEAPIRSQAGTRVVSDFVELPSMIMENWCWERDALDLFARHHETGAPIPEDVKDRMLRARTFRAANALMRQLGFSTVDLALHTRGPGERPADVLAEARRVFAPFAPTPVPDDYAMVAAFSHLFGAPYGYAAGYYSYQWSEALQADAFSRFREGGVLSADVGRAFRETILATGDGRDAGDLVRAFLGREPNERALLEHLGLA